jgi:hypothetical protein
VTGRQIMATLQDELAKRDAILFYRVREEVYTQLGESLQTVADKLAADITAQLNRQVQQVADHINIFADQLQVNNSRLLRLLAERKPTRSDEEEEQRDD